jgi:hypothetical protein
MNSVSRTLEPELLHKMNAYWLVSAAESDRVDIARTFPVSAHDERDASLGQDEPPTMTPRPPFRDVVTFAGRP